MTFPDHRLVAPRSSHHLQGKVRNRPASRCRQIALAALCLLGAAWLSYASVQVLLYKHIVAAKVEDIERQRIAYFDLMGEVSEYHEQFALIARNLEDNQAYLLTLLTQDDQGAENRAGAGWPLKDSGSERARIEITRAGLRRKLEGLRSELGEGALASPELVARAEALLAGFSRQDSDAASLNLVSASQGNTPEIDRGMANTRMARLGDRLTGMQDSQQAVVELLTERTLSSIDEFKSTVATTGLDLDNLLPEPLVAGAEGDQGGPFIPGDYLVQSDPALSLQTSIALLDLHMDNRESLQAAVGALPLVAPLEQFRITSGFGSRPDPFSGRTSYHFGLDLAARPNTPVVATAPGRVVFAGWKGHYGRTVEINHGTGVRTRYGHLRKILVKMGQAVSNGEKIGLVGSSGRSTGPHLHYEVRVNGKPFDPMNFLNAGQRILKG